MNIIKVLIGGTRIVRITLSVVFGAFLADDIGIGKIVGSIEQKKVPGNSKPVIGEKDDDAITETFALFGKRCQISFFNEAS